METQADPDNGFPVREMDLVAQLGVGRARLSDLRIEQPDRLERGKDWSKIGNSVCYTNEAARWIIYYFVPEGLPVKPVCFAEQDTIEAEVVRANFANRHVILVKNGAKEPFLIRVHDSTNFIAGMKVRAKNLPGETLPILVGRCPRFRGRW